MDAVQTTLTLVAAVATSAYAIFVARGVMNARVATGPHSLSRTIRRARYEIAQQMPLDIAGRIAAELSLIPPLEIRTPDIHVIAGQDETIAKAAGSMTEAIDALRITLTQGWRLIANPAIRSHGSASDKPFLFDAVIEGSPGRLPCIVEVKVIRRNQFSSSSLSTLVYEMNARTRQLQTATGQEFQQLLLAVVDDPNDAMTVRQFLRASRGVVEPSNTFVGSFYPRSGIDFATTWPPFSRPTPSRGPAATTVGGLTG